MLWNRGLVSRASGAALSKVVAEIRASGSLQVTQRGMSGVGTRVF